ncbi:MAG: hypothetical protein ACJA1A_002651 [Saprospiraceae bacterium]|jgi:hypothetical protein
MKSLKFIMTVMAFGLLTMSIYSCGGNNKTDTTKTEQAEDVSKQGKEYTSNYICPMHCEESGSDKPGKCPVCGMDYKMNDKSNTEDHSGHNH